MGKVWKNCLYIYKHFFFEIWVKFEKNCLYIYKHFFSIYGWSLKKKCLYIYKHFFRNMGGSLKKNCLYIYKHFFRIMGEVWKNCLYIYKHFFFEKWVKFEKIVYIFINIFFKTLVVIKLKWNWKHLTTNSSPPVLHRTECIELALVGSHKLRPILESLDWPLNLVVKLTFINVGKWLKALVKSTANVSNNRRTLEEAFNVNWKARRLIKSASNALKQS